MLRLPLREQIVQLQYESVYTISTAIRAHPVIVLVRRFVILFDVVVGVKSNGFLARERIRLRET